MRFIIQILFLSLICSVNIFSQERIVKSYYPNDTLKSEISFVDSVRNGAAKFYYPNGKVKLELNYSNGKVDGVVKEYYDNGNLKEMYTIEDGRRNGAASLFDKDGKYLKDITYEDGKFANEEIPAVDTSKNIAALNEANKNDQTNSSGKTNQPQNETGNVSTGPESKPEVNQKNSEYLQSAEVMPEPVGGIQTIMKKLIYPASAKENEIQGTVKIRAYIDEYGEVTQDEVVQGIGHGCDEAAKISVYYTKFTPGLIKGKPVKTQVVIPIEFKLNKK